MGNPKKMSRFICLKHCGENHILDGLQRGGHQREKKHIKDAFCIECQDITKNIDVIRLDRQYRSKWSKKSISGIAISKYLIECLENKTINCPWK